MWSLRNGPGKKKGRTLKGHRENPKMLINEGRQIKSDRNEEVEVSQRKKIPTYTPR